MMIETQHAQPAFLNGICLLISASFSTSTSRWPFGFMSDITWNLFDVKLLKAVCYKMLERFLTAKRKQVDSLIRSFDPLFWWCLPKNDAENRHNNADVKKKQGEKVSTRQQTVGQTSLAWCSPQPGFLSFILNGIWWFVGGRRFFMYLYSTVLQYRNFLKILSTIDWLLKMPRRRTLLRLPKRRRT